MTVEDTSMFSDSVVTVEDSPVKAQESEIDSASTDTESGEHSSVKSKIIVENTNAFGDLE